MLQSVFFALEQKILFCEEQAREERTVDETVQGKSFETYPTISFKTTCRIISTILNLQFFDFGIVISDL